MIVSSNFCVTSITLAFLNSSYFTFPISSMVFTIITTASPITSFLSSWNNSTDSSEMKGLPNCSNSIARPPTCFLNFSWKLGESSWSLNSECSFSFSSAPFTNSVTSLATSGLHICQWQNFFSFSVNPIIPVSPVNKKNIRNQYRQFSKSKINFMIPHYLVRDSKDFFKEIKS